MLRQRRVVEYARGCPELRSTKATGAIERDADVAEEMLAAKQGAIPARPSGANGAFVFANAVFAMRVHYSPPRGRDYQDSLSLRPSSAFEQSARGVRMDTVGNVPVTIRRHKIVVVHTVSPILERSVIIITWPTVELADVAAPLDGHNLLCHLSPVSQTGLAPDFVDCPRPTQMLCSVFDCAAKLEGRCQVLNVHLSPGLAVVDVHGLNIGALGIARWSD